MSRPDRRARLTGRREGGSFSAWPHACNDSENFCRLSLPARALLFEFLGQIRRANNGDLSCAWALLKPRGWRSRDTIERARAELERAGWIIRTRQGGRNAPNLYAVTWLSIEHCGGKLDISPGAPPSTWRKPFAMTGSRATLPASRSTDNPPVVQPPSLLAREAA